MAYNDNPALLSDESNCFYPNSNSGPDLLESVTEHEKCDPGSLLYSSRLTIPMALYTLTPLIIDGLLFQYTELIDFRLMLGLVLAPYLNDRLRPTLACCYPV